MQVIDEYDEQSEVAERLRIKVIYGIYMLFFVRYDRNMHPTDRFPPRLIFILI